MNDNFFLASSISLFLLGAAFIIMSVPDEGIPVQTIKPNIIIDINGRAEQHKMIGLLLSSHFFKVSD